MQKEISILRWNYIRGWLIAVLPSDATESLPNIS